MTTPGGAPLAGPADPAHVILGAESAWKTLMRRIGYRTPQGIKHSSKMLDEIDRINGRKSTAYPF